MKGMYRGGIFSVGIRSKPMGMELVASSTYQGLLGYLNLAGLYVDE